MVARMVEQITVGFELTTRGRLYLRQRKDVKIITDVSISFVLLFRQSANCQPILSTEFKEIATVGSFRLSSELTILHSIYHMREKYANTTAGITPTLQVK